jgi:hypothetical protein
MLFVISNEIIPETHGEGHEVPDGRADGWLAMMMLWDLILS